MRDLRRIMDFCLKFTRFWMKYPDYRFIQIANLFISLAMVKLNKTGDPFFIEDTEWIKALDELNKEN